MQEGLIIWLVGGSLILLLVLLVRNSIKPSMLFGSLVISYYLFDLLSLEKMLNNFVNPALVSLVLLLLIGMALEKTLFIGLISQKLFNASLGQSLFKMTFFTALSSAFLNNTAVVASMMSVVKQNRFHAPSKLLIPLSYAAIFGGVITLIGTSTNLIVNGLMIERGLEPLGLFDFVYVGVPIMVAGIGVLLLVVRFLPEYKHELKQESYFIEATIAPKSALIGKSIKDNGLRNLEYLFLTELVRQGHVYSPVGPDELLQEGDILLFSGDVKEIKILEKFSGLKIEYHHHSKIGNLIEVVVSHESTLIGEQIKHSNFRTKFDAAVVAIKRGNQKLSGKIGEIILQAGDSLVLATGSEFYQHDNLKKNFYFMSPLRLSQKLNTFHSWIALGGFLGVVLASALGAIALIKGLFFLLIAYVVLGYLELGEMKRRFPYDIVLIVGSALGISAVIVDSGLSSVLANALHVGFSGFGVYGAFISVYLLAFILTEIITNNASAALAFPIAYTTALGLDVNMAPFMMAVAYGASASFMTPYGYQTNLMVASAGGYSFKTFIKSGFFVSIAYSLVALILIPLFFPF